jgi:hypothetical protein
MLVHHIIRFVYFLSDKKGNKEWYRMLLKQTNHHHFFPFQIGFSHAKFEGTFDISYSFMRQ